MNREGYLALHNYTQARPQLKTCVTLCTKLLPGVVYLSYPVILLYTLFTRSSLLGQLMSAPAAGFLLCTVLRSRLNLPRPYEKYDIPAIVSKNTHGKSCPSRHAACAAVIAVTVLPVYRTAGLLLLVLSFLIAVSRVLAGVHFIRDVVLGWFLGAAVGILGILILF